MNKDHRMYLRKLWLIIAVPAVMVLGAMASPLAFSLGLGEITLNSNLNQPLDAEIKLLQVRDLSREEILVQLGSADDFRRRGIERIFFLQDIRFDVQLNSPNGPVIKLSTQKPVVEPFLIFIVQLEWPSGRAQREYTLLLDLPVFTERPAQPVQRPQTQPQPTTPPVQQAQPRPQTPPKSLWLVWSLTS
jgi:pilus assembly protein FimV